MWCCRTEMHLTAGWPTRSPETSPATESPDVASPGNRGVWLWTGKRDGTLNPGVMVASVPSPHEFAGGIATADFNEDGKLDLAVSVQGNGSCVTTGGEDPSTYPSCYAAQMSPYNATLFSG